MIFLFANVIGIYRIREKEGKKKKRKQGQKGGGTKEKKKERLSTTHKWVQKSHMTIVSTQKVIFLNINNLYMQLKLKHSNIYSHSHTQHRTKI